MYDSELLTDVQTKQTIAVPGIHVTSISSLNGASSKADNCSAYRDKLLPL
jgi:hypothetical protein